MRVKIVATVTRAGQWSGSRASAQIPTFHLDDVTSLHNAVSIAYNVLDPHHDALTVSIGATDDDGNYLGSTAERATPKSERVIRESY